MKRESYSMHEMLIESKWNVDNDQKYKLNLIVHSEIK